MNEDKKYDYRENMNICMVGFTSTAKKCIHYEPDEIGFCKFKRYLDVNRIVGQCIKEVAQ